MSSQLEREIEEQPAALARLLTNGRDTCEQIARAIRAFGPRFIVTAARGSSDNAARYAKYLFGAHNRLVVSLGAPSLVTLYGSPPSLEGALVLGISQSGQSPDIAALLAEGRRQGALTVALTNEPTSPLARAAAHVVDLGVGTEHSVAATKSYTAQILALAMLSAALEGDARRWSELARVPDAAAETLAAARDAMQASHQTIATLARSQRLVVLGRGFNYATVFEIALKIKETAYVLAEASAAPDMFHGPLAIIEPGFPVLVVAPSGAARQDLESLLDALEQRGAALIAISDDETILSRATVSLPLRLAAGVEEWLSPITAVLPGQLFAVALARARGHDPDRPRGLTKVTRTM